MNIGVGGARVGQWYLRWDKGEAGTLYDKLAHTVLPLFQGGETGGWAQLMKGVISKNAAYFNSIRMMRRYATEAYLR
jgi:glycogen phosphorylase